MSTDLLSGLEYEELMAELGQRMARISKEATCSSWHERIEEELPQVCYEVVRRSAPELFDTAIISVLEARLLLTLAERLGHWVTRRPGRRGWMPHIPKAMRERASRTGHTATNKPTTD